MSMGVMVFVHIVFFNFKRLTDRAEAKRRLEGLVNTVPSLRTVEVGLDEVRSDRSWDMVLITRFDDRAGYEAYAVDSTHLEVVSWLKSVIRASATVDYAV